MNTHTWTAASRMTRMVALLAAVTATMGIATAIDATSAALRNEPLAGASPAMVSSTAAGDAAQVARRVL
jgi:hypothetical protein